MATELEKNFNAYNWFKSYLQHRIQIILFCWWLGVGVGVGVGVLTINGSPINQVSEYTYQCKPYLGQPYR